MWDKNKPAGSQKLRLADDDIRANNEALEIALSEGHEFVTGGGQSGKHTTPTFKDNTSDPPQPTVTNEIRMYNKAGVMYNFKQSGVKEAIGGIPPGTKMLFKQNAAPVGWTFLAEDNDRALLNTSTVTEGGSTGGSWTISGLSIQVNNHTLTIAQIPQHRHLNGVANNNAYPFVYGGTSQDMPGSATTEIDDGVQAPREVQGYTSYVGESAAHSHDSSISQNGSWRPAYVKVITCRKD